MKPIYFIILLFCLVSCKRGDVTNCEVVHLKPTIIVDSLFMEMPGQVYFVNKNIIIENALATKNFYQVYRSSGEFVKMIAPVGNSSVEFITPNLTSLVNDDIIISDLNRGNAIIYENGVDSICQYNNLSSKQLMRYPLLNISNDIFVTLNNDFKGEIGELFSLYDNNTLLKSFGKFPIKEKFNNRYNLYQGALCYNKNNRRLVFFSYKIPYYAIYEMNDIDFKLIKEETYGEYDYEVKNNNLKIIDVEKSLIKSEVALLKDYIVTLGNTKEDLKHIPESNGRGRDFSRLPRSLFIHDYDYNLIKIISLQTPILRITSNIESNVLYLINYIDAEFNLSEVNVD